MLEHPQRSPPGVRVAVAQRDLATLMDIDRSSLVLLLNPLESDGCISRARDKDDRRRHVVSLTRRGEKQLDRAAQAQRDVEDDLFASLTNSQRDRLRELLLTVRDHLSPERKIAHASQSRERPRVPSANPRPAERPVA